MVERWSTGNQMNRPSRYPTAYLPLKCELPMFFLFSTLWYQVGIIAWEERKRPSGSAKGVEFDFEPQIPTLAQQELTRPEGLFKHRGQPHLIQCSSLTISPPLPIYPEPVFKLNQPRGRYAILITSSPLDATFWFMLSGVLLLHIFFNTCLITTHLRFR